MENRTNVGTKLPVPSCSQEHWSGSMVAENGINEAEQWKEFKNIKITRQRQKGEEIKCSWFVISYRFYSS